MRKAHVAARTILGAVFAFIVLFGSSNLAGAENRIESSVARGEPSSSTTALQRDILELGFTRNQGGHTSSSSSDASVSKSKAARRCAHRRTPAAKRRCMRNLKWFFYMPKNRARAVVQETVEYARDTTSPDEFDSSIDPPSYWDRASAGDCKRKAYSRMQCLAVLAADFDIVDRFGDVVDEDTFLCGWYQEVWYPYARKPRLKTRITQRTCFWSSEA
jgi:hypothetical protein